MKSRPDHISDDLLAAYFSGEATHAQKEKIETWANESADNQAELDSASYLWKDLGAVPKSGHEEKEFDVDLAWNQFEQTNLQTQNKNTSQLKIAAAITMLISGSWLLYSLLLSNQEVELLAGGDTITQMLPDNSSITLNENSKLVYPEEFDAGERRIKLSGEAYFEVTSNPAQPFIVETQRLEVRVLGTSFNVAEDSLETIIYVDEGIVQVATEDDTLRLIQGNTALYNHQTQKLIFVEDETSGMHSFWKTRFLSFDNLTLENAIKAIESSYEVEINLANPSVNDCRISVSFRDENVDNVLDIIASTLDLTLTRQNNEYLLSGEGCSE